jgi:hypothetical protein
VYDTYRYQQADSRHENGSGMDDKELVRIGPGFYFDQTRALYVNIGEFLRSQNLPDTAEVRRAIWEQIRRDFGAIGITELPED